MLEILVGINLVVSIAIIIILIRGSSEYRETAKRVGLKSLQLKEQAIDMQMRNVGGFLQSMGGAGQELEDEEEEESDKKQPIGYARK